MAVPAKNALVMDAGGLDLAATLFCGQSFAWRESAGGAFQGVAGNRAVLARLQGQNLVLTRADGAPPAPGDEAFWRRYFALDMDYGSLLDGYCQNQTLAACVAHSPGIRVLRQPFFETLLCFIVSQNNHIPRITAIAGRLRTLFGERLWDDAYAYPTPEALCGLDAEALAPLRAGFRVPYLLDAAKKVASGDVTEEKLAALPNEEARRLLCTIRGVGPKVADCVLLYSLGRSDVVPMDVWMKRAMQQLFPHGMPPEAQPHTGIAQQFIFCWARSHLGKP